MAKTTVEKRNHKYLKLADHFRQEVRSGALKPGQRLPSFAQMQSQYGIGQGTLERAYALLEDEKLIIREPKKGTFVAEKNENRTSGIVGVASGIHPSQNPYYFHLLEGVQDVAFNQKVEVLLLHDLSQVKWEKVDGVILAGADIQTPPTMPVVSLVRPRQEAHNVLADDFQGGRDATEHLLQLGHERIAFLWMNSASGIYNHGQERVNGYHAALEAAGIKPKKSWKHLLREPWEPGEPGGGFINLGYKKMTSWLQEDWHKLGLTALLVHNDDAAIGALRALRQAKISVPDDVSVMGFDGTEVADHIRPSLSTVIVPLREIGARGMQLMLQTFQQNSLSAHSSKHLREVLPTRLKIQDSTAAAQQS